MRPVFISDAFNVLDVIVSSIKTAINYVAIFNNAIEKLSKRDKGGTI